ncbi:MAG: hypothetical protein JXA89_24650 [Anaerolineae bacterium]|nr:hypothetical protein [Anaerolineae bacterium]
MSELTAHDIPYQKQIETLTKAKLARDGYHGTDDHGSIYWTEPIPFTTQNNQLQEEN